MKKLFWLLLLIICVVIGGSYIFISDELKIVKVTMLPTNKRTAYRCVTQRNLLQLLLEDSSTTQANDNAYFFKREGIAFTFKRRTFDLVEVPISYKNSEWSSVMAFTEFSPDSTGVEWKTEMNMSNNPFKRIQQYRHATQVNKSMSRILNQLQKFTSSTDNVYGLKIIRTTLADSLLVTTKLMTSTYPSTQDYYALIRKLQNYVSFNKATGVNYPMLNITQVDSTKFETTVAIPVNKVLPDNGDILFKKMFPGNILTTEVKGGSSLVEDGFSQLTNYVSDFKLMPPAISFQSLVTDRLLQGDTAKWVTKLYYPIY